MNEVLSTYMTTRLLVNDYRRSLDFYRETLGLPLCQMIGNDDGPYCEFGLEDNYGGRIALIARASLPPEPLLAVAATGDRMVLSIHVADVSTFIATLEAKGVTLELGVQQRGDWGIKNACLRDPDGNLIELFDWIPTQEE